MKLDFVEVKEITPEWNGNRELPAEEQFTVSLRTLSVDDLLDLLDVMTSMGVDEGADMKALPIAQAKDLIKGAQKLLPTYATINNLFTAAGEIMTIEAVCVDARMLDLSIEIFSDLMDISQVNEEDEGK
jgi:hypothetical protein